MIKVSALFYELTADEVNALPSGFQVLEMNTEYNTMSVFTAKDGHARRDKNVVYVSMKLPPVTSSGSTRSKLVNALRQSPTVGEKDAGIAARPRRAGTGKGARA